MDIRMPERDGYEATRWLRQHGWQGPVVAPTASAMDSDREECLNAGCDAHVAKPVSLAALREILTKFRVPAAHGVSPKDCVAEPQVD